MEIDIKKLMKTPDNIYGFSDELVKVRFELLDAIHIMQSALEFNTSEYKELNEKKMSEFIKKFSK